ncbi:AI-2E family transporter [Alkalibacter rhizosphaerae]|uniref:AI-2E family transporter n=1 Tax=Alkalibacter rhizosphaerae TaxID=2815577 RepID=A0A975AJ97_9FIRM|nr:AI-2E family transporter [Alkalibacter rhizosphaerae]QSX09370.1 AI-2E family transporter [Alkalibacter rhizosphaerae]
MDKTKFKQYFLIITYGIVLYVALTNLEVVSAILEKLHRITRPLIFGFVIAYLLNIPYKGFRKRIFYPMEKKGATGKKVAAGLSILSTYLLVIVTGGVLVRFIIPQLVGSITQLIENIPNYIVTVEGWANYLDETFGLQEMIDWYDSDLLQNLNATLNQAVTRWIPIIGNYLLGLTSGLYNWIIGLIISVYFLYGKDVLLEQMVRLSEAVCPRRFFGKFMEIARRTNHVFNRFITGNVIDSSIIALICFISMNLMNMPYVLLVTVIIGLTNLIPIVGPFIGAVPAIFIIMIVDPIKALMFFFFIIALQQLDGNVIKPKVLGNTVGLPGLWVLVSIILGAGLYGIVGMLMGVPTFALLYSLFGEWIDHRLERGEDSICEK